MSLYLDTNAIRKIGRKLPELSKKAPLKISVLGQLEIVSRAMQSEADYHRCKTQFQFIQNSDLKIDERMPDQLLLMGFDYILNLCGFKEERVERLNNIISALTFSNDLQSFVSQESQLALKYPFGYFKNYDDTFGNDFKLGFAEETRIIREAFEDCKSGKKPSTIVPSEIINGSFQNFCKWFLAQDLINESATINGLAHRAVSELNNFEIVGNHFAGDIHDSYNGKISAFVGAISRLTMVTHMNGGSPGRNDPLDLAHFLYIQEGDLLVSSDVKMVSIASHVGVPVRSPESLLTLVP